MLQRFLAKYLSLVVTLVGAIALSLESYLSLGNKSLCQTKVEKVEYMGSGLTY